MKKLLFVILLIAAIAALIYLYDGKNKSAQDISTLFDEKSGDNMGAVETIQPGQNIKPVDNPEQSQTPEQEQTNASETEKDNALTEEESNETVSDAEQAAQMQENEVTFTHTDLEKQKIVGKYIEAEDFYYSMLYQQYDLDSYDVITRKNSDGYDTKYHRVLYYDVNSVADLKEHYLNYFTNDFVSRIDFSFYIEENGKLYCTIMGSSREGTGTKYTYSVESIDSSNAYVVRANTNGSGSTKIKAENIGGSWYFSSVAIK